MYFNKFVHYIFIIDIIWVLRCSAQSGEFGTICDEFYNDSCFTHIKSPFVSWEESEQSCISKGGHLTSILSQNENEMLTNLVKTRNDDNPNSFAWIGLMYLSNDVGFSDWADGSSVTYIKNIPDNRNSGCIIIVGTGMWITDSCTEDRSYICRNTGISFAIGKANGYEAISNGFTINTSPATLACRTDSYPQARQIKWEYKASEGGTWISVATCRNDTSGISELTVSKNGIYRCNVTSGGIEQMYTATLQDPPLTTAPVRITTGTTTSKSSPVTKAGATPTSTNTTSSSNGTNSTLNIPMIAGGAIAGVVVIAFSFTALLITIIIIAVRKRKPKEYQYLSKVKYSNSLSLAVPPANTRPSKVKNDKITYEYLIDVTPGIDITEKELMTTLEDSNIEIPESVYSSHYVNLPVHSKQKKKVYYEDITEFVDPRMEPIDLPVYKHHLSKLLKNSAEFEDEYKSMGGVALKFTCENAVLEHNRNKNKYKMILPYDKSRVILTPLNDDFTTTYINASFIPGLYCKENFIAAQAPKDNTITDFWRMVMEHNVTNIVMLTNVIEGNRKKCEMYFPIDSRTPEQFGNFEIRQTSAETFLGFLKRTFEVTDGKKKLKINHFHFTAWPDHDVPNTYDELLNFIQKVHKEVKGNESQVLVHCSAGVGRTGTFITLFNILSAIEKSEPMSIYKIVHDMREHRPQMVQTFRQYKFIHLSVAEMLFQDTSIEASKFTATYKQYLETDADGYESVLFQQFNELNFQTEEIIELPFGTGSNPQNAKKNPSGKIFPYDENRVVLLPLVGDNDYINASYIFNLNFIATVHPNAHTLADFLQMVTQTSSTLVIMLTTRKEKGEIDGRTSKRASYWGKTDESVQIYPFTVRNTHSEKSTSLIKQNLTVDNPEDGMSHNFTQMTSFAWNEKGEPTDLANVLVLIQAMREYKQENPHLPIIVHCSDGIGKTGVLLSTYRVIEHIKNKDHIDIFHVIKGLRSERMNFVPTLNHFMSCFALVNEYCSTTI